MQRHIVNCLPCGHLKAVSQLLWPHKSREEWFSLRENHG
jgi:hypothetical protein